MWVVGANTTEKRVKCPFGWTNLWVRVTISDKWRVEYVVVSSGNKVNWFNSLPTVYRCNVQFRLIYRPKTPITSMNMEDEHFLFLTASLEDHREREANQWNSSIDQIGSDSRHARATSRILPSSSSSQDESWMHEFSLESSPPIDGSKRINIFIWAENISVDPSLFFDLNEEENLPMSFSLPVLP